MLTSMFFMRLFLSSIVLGVVFVFVADSLEFDDGILRIFYVISKILSVILGISIVVSILGMIWTFSL